MVVLRVGWPELMIGSALYVDFNAFGGAYRALLLAFVSSGSFG